MNKIDKIRRFWPSAGEISVQLEDEYYENGENVQIWKIYNNFRLSVHIPAKIIINFSDFSGFSIFVIFIFKLDANFPYGQNQSIFDFIHYFGFMHKKASISTISGEFD